MKLHKNNTAFRSFQGAVNSNRFVLAVWILVGVIIPYRRFLEKNSNNYFIFKNACLHLIENKALYTSYQEGLDLFMYGPLFGVLMAPYAFLPDSVGSLLYLITSALLLYLAIQILPIARNMKNGICLLCLVEFGNNQQHFQFNATIAALIILSFTLILRHREVLATLCISLAIFTKLYGLMALPFFLFSKNKRRFVVALLCWAVLAYTLPIIFSSPHFVFNSYVQWFELLAGKNQTNLLLGGFQDKSVIGVI
ncbi:MAG: DUF2029 domain-containing protein [Kiritimatiellae bacterium]|nr:DUF2029 domain-containing protein [Kiritimatiellia bacterium]